MKKTIILFLLLPTLLFSQEKAKIFGKVSSNEKALPYANISVKNSSIGTVSDESGAYELELVPSHYRIVVTYIGYEKVEKSIYLSNKEEVELNFQLKETANKINEVVINEMKLPTKSASYRQVELMGQQQIKQTNAMNLAEAVQFMPSVRVENNCQNCGFTQLRINGLPGSYSQILINNRPVFSAMTSVYGLEQIPTAMIKNIELSRNGGTSIHAANAIAGTVNLITQKPVYNSWSIEQNTAAIDANTIDLTQNFHASLVDEEQKMGVNLFGSQREKSDYDANDDGFSELPKMNNTSFGANAFYRLNQQNAINMDFSSIREYRRGGDRLDIPSHFADISEQIESQSTILSLDYERKGVLHEFSTYFAFRNSDRDSYYGGLGGSRTSADSLLATKSYGETSDYSIIGGVKSNYQLSENIKLINGIDIQYNEVEDQFPAFQRSTQQKVYNPALYGRFIYDLFPSTQISAAYRLDYIQLKGNYALLNQAFSNRKNWTTINPRLTIAHQINDFWKVRLFYASGFRPPQSFNEDMHISTAAGETVFTLLSENLKAEKSNAYNAELQFEKAFDKFDFQLKLDGFYTEIHNTFTEVSAGKTTSGAIVNRLVNGTSTLVYGSNFQLKMKKDYEWNVEVGGTIQDAHYSESQLVFESEFQLIKEQQLLRTPNLHAYLFMNKYLSRSLSLSLNGKYTGSMLVPRLNSTADNMELINSDDFMDINIRVAKDFLFKNKLQLQISIGVQNVFNSYQSDFSSGPLRDSDYIYGPMRPRTYFLSLKFGSFQ